MEIINLHRLENQWNRLDPILITLWNVYREHSMEKWDGLGANPITTIAIEEASRLLMEFPSSYPLPDLDNINRIFSEAGNWWLN